MKMKNRWVRALLGAALIAGPLAACADFIAPPEEDPNAVGNAALDQLFVAIQVNTYMVNEGPISRVASMWTQQMWGTDRQFVALSNYTLGEEEGNNLWARIYTGGGLIDIRKALERAEGRRAYQGILKIHEAFLIGTAASVFGDVPYSQAGDPNNPTPERDPQLQVYNQVIALLDEAITDLQTGQGAPTGGVDFNFGGDTGAWIRVANSLKARYHMHLARVENGRYQQAIQAAQAGINTPAGNWQGIHSATSTEHNLWAMFIQQRSGYISGGPLVDTLRVRNDPRLQIYFTPGSEEFAGRFVGAFPGANDPGVNASQLNIPGSPTYNQPIVSCAETQFIIAEAAYRTGQTGLAQSALEAGIRCQEQKWEVTIPRRTGLTGQALLHEIMMQKRIALFLNFEAWNDYIRTCLPPIKPNPSAVGPFPRRLLYPSSERLQNPNIPAPDVQPARNPNDPGCP